MVKRGARRVITCTSRPSREGEVNGVHYHFLDIQDFIKSIAQGEFIEHAVVYGKYYGIRHVDLLETWLNAKVSETVVLTLDVQGACTLQEYIATHAPALLSRLITVFMAPNDKAVLHKRLVNRGDLSEGVLERRFREAHMEMKLRHTFDYYVPSTTFELDLELISHIIEFHQIVNSLGEPNYDD